MYRVSSFFISHLSLPLRQLLEKMASFKDYLPFYKRNLKVALPIMFAQLGGAVVQFADVKMVGALGTVELAAVAFANSVLVIALVASMTLLQSITPLAAYKYVNHEHEEVTKYLQNGLVQCLLVSFGILAVLTVAYFNLERFGQDPAVCTLAKNYFKIVAVSFIPVIFFEGLRQFLAALGNTSVAMWITLISNVVNVVFNYLLIYGKYGFPELGVDGAAISTLLSRVLSPLAILGVMFYNPTWRKYVVGMRNEYFSKSHLYELFKVGIPISLRSTVEVTAFAFSGIMVGWLGAVPLASNQIASSVGHMVFMIVLGIGAATTIRVSHQYGRKDYNAVCMAANASIHLAFLNNAIMGALIIIYRYEIARFFSDDPLVIDQTASILILAGIYQVSDGLQCVGIGILNGLTDVKYTMWCAFVSYLLVNLPVGYYLGFIRGWGAEGVWTGFIFGLTLAAILFHIRWYKMMNRIKKQAENDSDNDKILKIEGM